MNPGGHRWQPAILAGGVMREDILVVWACRNAKSAWTQNAKFTIIGSRIVAHPGERSPRWQPRWGAITEERPRHDVELDVGG